MGGKEGQWELLLVLDVVPSLYHPSIFSSLMHFTNSFCLSFPTLSFTFLFIYFIFWGRQSMPSLSLSCTRSFILILPCISSLGQFSAFCPSPFPAFPFFLLLIYIYIFITFCFKITSRDNESLSNCRAESPWPVFLEGPLLLSVVSAEFYLLWLLRNVSLIVCCWWKFF